MLAASASGIGVGSVWSAHAWLKTTVAAARTLSAYFI
jgi:hypothetical protein